MLSGLSKAFQGAASGERKDEWNHPGFLWGFYRSRSFISEHWTVYLLGRLQFHSEYEKDAELQVVLLRRGETWPRKGGRGGCHLSTSDANVMTTLGHQRFMVKPSALLPLAEARAVFLVVDLSKSTQVLILGLLACISLRQMPPVRCVQS